MPASAPGGTPGHAIAATDWTARFDELRRRGDVLTAAELDDLGLAAWFLGREDDCEAAWTRAQAAYLDAGEADAAMACIFWLGYTLGEHGHAVKARAWMGRLLALCEEHASSRSADAVAATCHAFAAWAQGRFDDSVRIGELAVASCRTAGDIDLEVLATMGLGRSLLASGRSADGFACMDGIMLAIASGRVSDRVAGPAYCAVIASCLERWDIERASEWTRELSDWCDAQRGLEPFRGECSVHRARVMAIEGEWDEAVGVLTEVADRERRPETRENALYALAELHRRAGRTDAATAVFREAARLGRDVQPGLAFAQRDSGHLASARAGIARALEAAPPPGARAELLAAQAEFEADGDIALARRAEQQLRALSESMGTVYLAALADRATATVLLASGQAETALPLLRRSWSAWRGLGDSYDGALTRILLGRAARALGDEEAAQLEFDAAGTVLTELGAICDLVRLERLAASAPPAAAAVGLSRRELEVLQCVTKGLSNREIAVRLFLSERTVARHVANILAKLGLPNRSAATAFAFEHGLVETA